MPLQNFWAYVFHRSCGWFFSIITNVFATFDNISSVVIIPAAAVWEPKWRRTPASPKVVASGTLETHEVSSHFILGSGHTCRALFRSIPPRHSFVSFRPLPDWRLTLFGDVPLEEKKIRPESVSDQRRTYPFPNPVTVNWQHIKVNLGLRIGRTQLLGYWRWSINTYLIKMLWSVRLIHHCLCKIMFLIYNWLSKEIRNGAFRDLTRWSNLQGNFSLVVCQFHNFPSFQLFFWKSKHLICVFICTS